MRKILFFAALLFAAPLFAQSARRPSTMDSFASDSQTIPVMGNATGFGGAQFRTYVALLNPTSSAFLVQATLYDATGTAHNAVLNLAAGEMKTFTNFLDAVFNGYVGGGAVTLQAVETPGGTHNNRFIVTTESYTAGAHYGTAIPSLEFAGSSSPSFAVGVTVDANTRTNVGCFNEANASNTVTARVFDSTGKFQVGIVTLNLAANAWGQTAVPSVVVDGFVRFEPSDSAVCYASVLQNSTNDARFVMATEYTP